MQSLAETFQAGQCGVDSCAVEPAGLIESCGQPDHFTQAIENDELPVRIAGDDHVETVGAQVDGGDNVGDFGAGHG